MYKDTLIGICRNYTFPQPTPVVIREPYIPYIPNNWNKVLVLAESQNLSSTNEQYVKQLESRTADERMDRLKIDETGEIGVWPWDDASLKIAVEAALGKAADETAVSNAVLWSQRGDSNQNVNPDFNLQTMSAELWREMLDVLKPELLICCGIIAQSVIHQTGWGGKILNWRLPSRTAMSRISGMFDENDLLMRFPEVQRIENIHKEWFAGGYRRNKIFFACHTVSIRPRN